MESDSSLLLKGRKILFATVPADGHVNPLTGLAKYLIDQAECDVRWYTASVYRDKITNLGIPHYSFVNALEITGENISEMLPERDLITDPVRRINFDLINMFGMRGPEYFKDIRELYESFPFDIMVADNLFTGIPFVKRLMNIPVISIGVIPLTEKSMDVAPYGSGLYPPKTDTERKDYIKMQVSFSAMVSESSEIFNGILNENGLQTDQGDIGESLLQSSDAYLQIGVPSFEYPRNNLGKNIRFIGALMPFSEKTKNATWTDSRLGVYKTIVLVTQGTVEHDVNKIIAPTLQAFTGTDVLVIATTGGKGTAELRKRFTSPNLIIEDYIPFQDIMPYASVFITNGGYSGTLLGIQNMLPIVAAGLHEAKNEVCARVGYFEYGINLQTETPSPDAIRKAVNQILSDCRYKENVEKLFEEMRRYQPEQLCANAIAELLDGDSN